MRFSDPRFATLRFVLIAVVFMLLADRFLLDGGPKEPLETARQEAAQQAVFDTAPPVKVSPPGGAAYFELAPDHDMALVAPDEPPPEATPAPPSKPPESAEALPPVAKPDVPAGAGKIAIIIDDLGMDVRRSREVLDLPAPITLAFLPYAPKTPDLAKAGKARGHELIIHTPMQAIDKKQYIGPMGLTADMDAAAFDKSLDAIFQSFDGYDGINNHMGSLLTQDETAMTHLMRRLKERGLFFVDSRTIAASVAADRARAAHVPYAVRDVFLDHKNTPEFVSSSLKKVERIARQRGYAIAIGHPRDETIRELTAWIPTLKEKGLTLVPVRSLLTRPAENAASAKGGDEAKIVSVPEIPAAQAPGTAADSGAGVRPDRDVIDGLFADEPREPAPQPQGERLPAIY